MCKACKQKVYSNENEHNFTRINKYAASVFFKLIHMHIFDRELAQHLYFSSAKVIVWSINKQQVLVSSCR